MESASLEEYVLVISAATMVEITKIITKILTTNRIKIINSKGNINIDC